MSDTPIDDETMDGKTTDREPTKDEHRNENRQHREYSPHKHAGVPTPPTCGHPPKESYISSWAGKNPILIRCLVVIGITMLLLLPLDYFRALVDERSELHDQAIANIAQTWGKQQTVYGPALIIPYATKPPQPKPRSRKKGEAPPAKAPQEIHFYVVFPKKLAFSTNLSSEKRYRGIHNYVVYTAPITIKGNYQLPEDGPFADASQEFFWDQAFFCLGVTDLKAIVSMGSLTWNNETGAKFASGMQLAALPGPGLHAKIRLSPSQKEYDFTLEMALNGSGGIYFSPVGENTSISITGTWPHPNFDAQLLPAKRIINEKGFSAEWAVSSLSRTYPQYGDISLFENRRNQQSLQTITAGVSLFETVSLYRQVTRAVKYGILFIGLTFTALFCFELVSRRQMHLVQYGLVGMAMTLFYLVLLSFAEHILFAFAFTLASATSALMCGVYVAAVLRSKKSGILIFALLSCLYSVLFALLRMEEYSLMVGTVLVILVVCGLMYFTRNLRPKEQLWSTQAPYTGEQGNIGSHPGEKEAPVSSGPSLA